MTQEETNHLELIHCLLEGDTKCDVIFTDCSILYGNFVNQFSERQFYFKHYEESDLEHERPHVRAMKLGEIAEIVPLPYGRPEHGWDLRPLGLRPLTIPARGRKSHASRP